MLVNLKLSSILNILWRSFHRWMKCMKVFSEYLLFFRRNRCISNIYRQVRDAWIILKRILVNNLEYSDEISCKPTLLCNDSTNKSTSKGTISTNLRSFWKDSPRLNINRKLQEKCIDLTRVSLKYFGYLAEIFHCRMHIHASTINESV